MNTKKINELTMMETVSDAANVLVEENGEAKRIPAGKMVAGSLPEHLQFGETVAIGDTLTWDGVSGAVEIPNLDGPIYHVSPVVITEEDVQDGAIIIADYTTEYSAEDFRFAEGPGVLMVPKGTIDVGGGTTSASMTPLFFIPYENFVMEDFITFPYAGIWAFEPFQFSLTIPGYTGFVTKTVKPIDKKYLPESVAQVTKFYVEYGRDCYIYTDETFNNRASKQDVLDAISKGVIYVHSNTGAMTLVSQILVLDYVQIKAALYAWENVDLNDFYTAEYVEEDAGPS